MPRSAREIHVASLDVLLHGRMAEVVRAKDWELLRHVAKLAASDAPVVLAATDPVLFTQWRAAVTSFHIKGWTRMTPERVDEVRGRLESVEATSSRHKETG